MTKQARCNDAGSYRVRRGGSWNSYAWYCRSANRFSNDPSYLYNVLGFRPARAR
jgi:formylglycine-generating enzyme required for sulfatase activity